MTNLLSCTLEACLLTYKPWTDCSTCTTRVVDDDTDSCAAMLKDPKIVEVRRMKLQTYLRLVVAQLSRDFPELVEHACRQTLVQTVPFFSYVSTVIIFQILCAALLLNWLLA